jgi:hypothetical protein
MQADALWPIIAAKLDLADGARRSGSVAMSLTPPSDA